jgi:hypothetical protein
MRTIIVALLCLFFVDAAGAWDEPDHFMGIKFWQELGSNANLKACRKSAWDPERETGVCYVLEAGRATIKNVDIGLGAFPWTTADLVDNKLARLTHTYQQAYFPTAIALFKERYGAATKVDTETFATKLGTSVQGSVVMWAGKRLSITIHERGGLLKIDHGEIIYETDTWREFSNKRDNDWVKQKSKGL